VNTIDRRLEKGKKKSGGRKGKKGNQALELSRTKWWVGRNRNGPEERRMIDGWYIYRLASGGARRTRGSESNTPDDGEAMRADTIPHRLCR
jgi:hypothetical protein